MVAAGGEPQATSGSAPEAKSKFGSRTELVLIPAIVTDQSGKHATGLQKEQFVVTENGAPQTLAVFEEVATSGRVAVARPAEAAREFTNRIERPEGQAQRLKLIVFDLINTPAMRQSLSRAALLEYLSGIADTREPTAIVSLSPRGVHVASDFTTDPAVLRAAIKTIHNTPKLTGETPIEAGIHETPQVGVTKYSEEADPAGSNGPPQFTAPPAGGAGRAGIILRQLEELIRDLEQTFVAQERRFAILSTLDGMQQIAQAYAGVPGRKSLIWVTAGFPYAVGDDSRRFTATARPTFNSVSLSYEELFHKLNDAQIAVYPVDVSGMVIAQNFDASVRRPADSALRTREWEERQRISTLNSFADQTGGRSYHNTNDLKLGFVEAAKDSRQYYLLGYYAPHGPNVKPGWQAISVKVAQKGVHVRARSGYFRTAGGAEPAEIRKPDLEMALYSPLDYTALPFTARWTTSAPSADKRRIGFEVVLPPGTITPDLEDGNHMVLDIVAYAKTLDGKAAAPPTMRTLEGRLTPAQVASLRDNGLTYANTLDLPPGLYKVRFVVRDVTTGRMGSLLASLTVHQ